MTKAAELAKMGEVLTTSQIGGRRNMVINGGFDVWQRGTSFSNVDNVYTADRMYVVAGGGTTGDNVTQQAFTVGQTDVPGEPTYYFRFTAGSTSSNKVVHHRIEDVRTGAGQTVTLSFWGKASTAHSSTIELGQNFGSGGSSQVVPASQSYSLTTSWQKFTFNVILPSISGKTIGTSSYLYIAFIRSLPASNVDIDIAQMQLEVGEQDTPFEHRSSAEELSLCQRYYFEGGRVHASAGENGTTNVRMTYPVYKVMRATPTVTCSSSTVFYTTDLTDKSSQTFSALTAIPLALTGSLGSVLHELSIDFSSNPDNNDDNSPAFLNTNGTMKFDAEL